MKAIRNRIVGHEKVFARDLVPHEDNFRTHPEEQRLALEALYEEVGFARSLLAYKLPDGRLKLLDGHLRRDIDPDMEVDVEIVDLNEDEARKMLLSIDPLVGMAEMNRETQQRLVSLTRTRSVELARLWNDAKTNSSRLDAMRKRRQAEKNAFDALPAQWLIIVDCVDEEEQLGLLEKLKASGHKVSAKTC